MFALSLGSALPTNYSTLGGLVWLAILVSLGIRSNMAALMAGLEDPVLSEAQLRALQAAESEARLQVVLEQRAAFLEIHAVLSPDQQAKALRLGLKQRKEREARLELEAERGN